MANAASPFANMPGFERFCALAQATGPAGGVIPVWRDCLLDTDTPVSAFAKLRRGPFAFLLESAPAGSERWSRYTFLGTEPRAAGRLTDGLVEDWTPDRGWHGSRRPADPLADLDAVLARDTPPPLGELEAELGAFWGGAVGYFGYDVVRYIERLASPPPKGLRVPDAMFVMTRGVVIIDNFRARARVVMSVPVSAGLSSTDIRARYDAALAEIEATLARLRAPQALAPLDLDPAAPAATGRSTYTREAYMRDVERIRDYVFAGDCFQA